jgi:hypothetical protein
VPDAAALLDFQSESFFFHYFAGPEPGRRIYTVRVQSLGGDDLVALVFVELYDYTTLRSGQSSSSMFVRERNPRSWSSKV